GDSRGAAVTRLLLGYAEQHRGDTATARRTLTQALDTLRGRTGQGDPVGEASALRALADLESQAGVPPFLAAESLYREGVARLGDRPAPSVGWPLHAGLGRVLWARGAIEEAAVELRVAIREVERVSRSLPLEERRSAFLADKW